MYFEIKSLITLLIAIIFTDSELDFTKLDKYIMEFIA
jgi:hypothetical protein